MNNYGLHRNAEGYSDPTARAAMTKVVSEDEADRKCHALLKTIFAACELAGFEIDGRITFREKSTGRMWR